MKDGTYALRFSADGYNGTGTLALQGNRGNGCDDKVCIEGQLVERGNSLSGSFSVLMDRSVSMNSRVPASYSVNMTGTSDHDRFALIGAGPLGVIVDIDCTWMGPLDARAD